MISKEDLKEVLHEALKESAHQKNSDDPIHRLHHQFVDMMMKREERRVKRWETIRTQIWGWGLIAALGAIGSWVATHVSFKH